MLCKHERDHRVKPLTLILVLLAGPPVLARADIIGPVTRYPLEVLPDKLDPTRPESPAPPPGRSRSFKTSGTSALLGLSCSAAAWIAMGRFRKRPEPGEACALDR